MPCASWPARFECWFIPEMVPVFSHRDRSEISYRPRRAAVLALLLGLGVLVARGSAPLMAEEHVHQWAASQTPGDLAYKPKGLWSVDQGPVSPCEVLDLAILGTPGDKDWCTTGAHDGDDNGVTAIKWDDF